MSFTTITSSFSLVHSQPFSLHRARARFLPSALPIGDLQPLSATSVASLAFVGVAAVLTLADPERRRKQQAEGSGGDEKAAVRDYFNSTGFERWRKIYGNKTDNVNRVQLDIRVGHAQTVDATLQMLKDSGSIKGTTICDAGCGTGLLTIPLAREGAIVSASDISASMVSEAQRQVESALATSPTLQMPKFEVKDLESLDGSYDTVICLDVLIHYPQDKAGAMIAHLASLAKKRVILSFAPQTFYFNFLKRVGELFPGPSKATRAYLHSERDVEDALRKAGWTVKNKGFISTQFYFAKLFEAVPIGTNE